MPQQASQKHVSACGQPLKQKMQVFASTLRIPQNSKIILSVNNGPTPPQNIKQILMNNEKIRESNTLVDSKGLLTPHKFQDIRYSLFLNKSEAAQNEDTKEKTTTVFDRTKYNKKKKQLKKPKLPTQMTSMQYAMATSTSDKSAMRETVVNFISTPDNKNVRKPLLLD